MPSPLRFIVPRVAASKTVTRYVWSTRPMSTTRLEG